MGLNARKQQVLEAIVESHIVTAEPVSSRSIARKYRLGVSPATIRNEMSDLEEMGLIEQPHTSAGRIPSQPGYRYYVDKLMKKSSLTSREEKIVRAIFAQRAKALANIIQRTIKTVTQLTDYLVLLSGPQLEKAALRKIKTLPLTSKEALVVIMTESGWVESKVVDLPSGMTAEDLEHLENVLNTYFQGLTFPQISRTILHNVYDELIKQRRVLDRIMEIVEAVLEDNEDDVIYLGGAQNILKQPEYSDIEEARNLMSFIEEDDILRKILKKTNPDEITVRIGREINYDPAAGYSVVSAVYSMGGNIVGAIGLLGPMRMDYAKSIAVVEYITDVLSDVLSRDAFD
ncbi:MAG: heat-inducible transcriptional repressor HrcA [Syntrophaceticus sp.]